LANAEHRVTALPLDAVVWADTCQAPALDDAHERWRPAHTRRLPPGESGRPDVRAECSRGSSLRRKRSSRFTGPDARRPTTLAHSALWTERCDTTRRGGGRYDRHGAQSVGSDKLAVSFNLRATTHADAIRSAGPAAATYAEVLIEHAAGVDRSAVALVVRAQ
jgi:hypothetical protein